MNGTKQGNEILIASPCISICALDENDICVGCYRSAAEITRWSDADNNERRAILVQSTARAKAANPFA
ncbi:MAG TPA: DUF1289 domain-containing protein [Pseudomonadales bacterium]|nr:DUF1289 domain-containing protein [Pseudomonadales bacterium]